MKTVYLSLGSNLGEREAMLRRALDELRSSQIQVRAVSSIYETEPVDFTKQGWFLNLAVQAETDLFPMRLLKRLRQIEADLGRERRVPKGPRPIDIDILFYGRAVIATPQLTVPHARLHERRFVLEPLAEIAPDLRHPVLGLSVRQMLRAIDGQACRKLEQLTP